MGIEGLSFEEAFKELEETVRQLEEGELTLDESITLFERGQELARYCSDKLEQAELKVSKLASLDEDYEEIPFEGK